MAFELEDNSARKLKNMRSGACSLVWPWASHECDRGCFPDWHLQIISDNLYGTLTLLIVEWWLVDEPICRHA